MRLRSIFDKSIKNEHCVTLERDIRDRGCLPVAETRNFTLSQTICYHEPWINEKYFKAAQRNSLEEISLTAKPKVNTRNVECTEPEHESDLYSLSIDISRHFPQTAKEEIIIALENNTQKSTEIIKVINSKDKTCEIVNAAIRDARTKSICNTLGIFIKKYNYKKFVRHCFEKEDKFEFFWAKEIRKRHPIWHLDKEKTVDIIVETPEFREKNIPILICHEEKIPYPVLIRCDSKAEKKIYKQISIKTEESP